LRFHVPRRIGTIYRPTRRLLLPGARLCALPWVVFELIGLRKFGSREPNTLNGAFRWLNMT
jgi:hypothetical protein